MADTGGEDRREQTTGAEGGGRPTNAEPPVPPLPLRPNSPRALREAEEDRVRQRQNIIAAIVVVGLLAACYWLINAMADAQKMEMCLFAHHSNCGPLDPAPPPQ